MIKFILGIDPGPKDSAFVLFDGKRLLDHGHVENEILLHRMQDREFGDPSVHAPYLTVIEQIQSYGNVVGADILETVFWSGQFAHASPPYARIKRPTIKRHLCKKATAKDFDVRVALMNRFGGGFPVTFTGHKFAALAVAVTWFDQHPQMTLEDLHATTV